MGFLPVLLRRLSPRDHNTMKEPSTKPMDAERMTNGSRDGAGWAKRKGKVGVQDTGTSPGAAVAEVDVSSATSNTTSSPLGPAPTVSPSAPQSPAHSAAPAAQPPSQTQTQAPSSTPAPGQPAARQVLPPRVPSVMYCPVLDKAGFGYGNEERRRADIM